MSDCDPMDCNPSDSLSMEFSRQEYWSGLPFPFPEDLSDPGIEHVSPAAAGRFFATEPPGKPYIQHILSTLKFDKNKQHCRKNGSPI